MRTEGAKILWTKNPPMRNKTARSRSRFAWTHSAQNSKQLNSLLRPPPTARVMTTKVPGSLKIPGSDNNTSSVSRAARSRRGRSSGKRVWALPAMRSALANRHYITPLPRMSAPFVPRLLGCGNGGGFRKQPHFLSQEIPSRSYPIPSAVSCLVFVTHPSAARTNRLPSFGDGAGGGAEPGQHTASNRAGQSSMTERAGPLSAHFHGETSQDQSHEKKVIHKCPLQKYRGRNPVFTPTT